MFRFHHALRAASAPAVSARDRKHRFAVIPGACALRALHMIEPAGPGRFVIMVGLGGQTLQTLTLDIV